jgi:hypothetical protein
VQVCGRKTLVVKQAGHTADLLLTVQQKTTADNDTIAIF